MPQPLCITSLLVLLAVSAHAEPTGRIEGKVADGVAAVVFILDADTGYPLHPENHRPTSSDNRAEKIENVWHVVADDTGAFVIAGLEPGAYRLAAQSWEGVAGIPQDPMNSRTKPPSLIHLHGVIDRVTVEADNVTRVVIQPLGDGELTLRSDPEESGAFVFISTHAPAGDPILGPWGWGEDYVRNIVGFAFFEEPRVTFTGLPRKQDLHVSAFFYDNSPGIAGGTFDLPTEGAAPVGILAIYAGWSNGHSEVPPKFQPIVDYLDAHPEQTIPQVLQLDHVANLQDKRGRVDMRKLLDMLLANPEQTVALADVGLVRCLDVIAADCYRSYRDAHHPPGK